MAPIVFETSATLSVKITIIVIFLVFHLLHVLHENTNSADIKLLMQTKYADWIAVTVVVLLIKFFQEETILFCVIDSSLNFRFESTYITIWNPSYTM